jgi:hypothetical protein
MRPALETLSSKSTKSTYFQARDQPPRSHAIIS